LATLLRETNVLIVGETGMNSVPEPIHELVARRAALAGEAVAVVDGDRSVTYAELDRRANQLSHLLIETGVRPGAVVGVLLDRCVNQVVSLLAIWKAGAAYVPLDPAAPHARTAAQLAETEAAAMLSASPVEGFAAIVLDDVLFEGRDGTAPAVRVTAADTAYVLYTSGSTGRPKGVVVGHDGIGNVVRWQAERFRMSTSDIVLHKTPLTFDAAGWEVFAPLVSGGTVVLAPQGAERDPARLVSAVAEHHVTILQVVPSVLRLLVDEQGWDRCGELRLLFSGGEQLDAELVQRFLRAVGRDVTVVNLYGPTECSVNAAFAEFDFLQRTGPVPIGKPIDGIRAVVLEGELYLGGPGVARGYVANPELTAERFVPDPDGGRLYRTGDLVRTRAHGELEYLGRADHQLKINGVRLEPAEIEAAVVAHPKVAQAVAAPFTSAAGTVRLAVYVRLTEPGLPDLRAFLATRLPESHLPSAFVEVAEFPLTTSGKLDRSALPSPDSGPRFVVSTATESLVAGVWRELLGIADIGGEDDFFRLGGSSLQFAKLANRLRAETGAELPLSALLTATTVAEQALLVNGSGAQAPLPRASRDGALPVSFGQRRLWLLDRLKPGGREWVSGQFLRVPDGTAEESVRVALDALVRRHEALRTRFAVEDGEPVQLIDPPAAVPLAVFDVEDLAAILDEDIESGFDLERGPLARALQFRTGEKRTLVLLMHHIICDGWSASVLEREFTEILDGRESGLPELRAQYADYAVWQREQLTDEVLTRELAHWRSALDGVVPTELRPDHRRPAVRDARGAVVPFTIPPDVALALRELGRRGDASPFMTLLTAFSTLLARYTARWDVVVGTPVAGRNRAELENVAGFFLNNLVLRCGLDGGLSFEQAIERVRDVCKVAFSHQDVPFEKLVAELAPERDLSRTPLYQIAFDLHDEELTGALDEPTEVGALLSVSRTAKTDLTLYLRARADGSMSGVLEYATSLFDDVTMERFAGHFVRLLRAVTGAPGARLSTLKFAEPGKVSPHAPAVEVTRSVLQSFETQAAATPDAVAIRTDTETVSYAELDRRATRLAAHLRALGAVEESVVGVLLDRGAGLLAAFLAVWKAGAAYLPLDPDFPAEQVTRTLDDAGAAIFVTQSRFAGIDFGGHSVLVDTDRLADSAGPVPRRDDLESAAYVIYTSGSTGRPKGVQITHRGLANHVEWAVRELASRGTGGAPVFSSVAFDLVVPNLWAPLLAGQATRMLPQDLDLSELGAKLAAAGPFSFIKLTPGHLDVLTRQLTEDQCAGLAGVLVPAGEALPPRLAEQWDGLINEYGPTETSVGALVYPVTAAVETDSVPIGRALPGMRVHLLDDALRPLPEGVAGELYIGGTGVARGYIGRPELTAERFLPDPAGPPGARMYRTGDLARLLPGGVVDFLGRADDQVKVRGYRVEPGEIAAVLMAHPSVRDAVVVPLPGPGGIRLVAYVVGEAGESLTEHCARELPAYLIPDVVTPIEAIPLTANGKLDRAALPEPAAPAEEVVAPSGIVEERIAEIFDELLGEPAGAHTHFFRQGGNSIMAIRLIAAIQSEFDVSLPIRAVFEGPTVARLARLVEDLVRVEIEGLSADELVAQTQETPGR
jgi:amino acid adenylation domain-containing protein